MFRSLLFSWFSFGAQMDYITLKRLQAMGKSGRERGFPVEQERYKDFPRRKSQ